MKLDAIVPMLWVADIPDSIRFYADLLGFRCTSEMEGWACLECDGVELMLSVHNAHEPFHKPHFTGSLYFRVDDVNELWERLKDKATVVYPIEDFDYGMREFAVRDRDGYLLQFGRPIA